MPTSRSNSKAIGITLGDPAGIGPEVVAKALANPSIRRLARFQIIGDEVIFRKYFSARYRCCSYMDLGCVKSIRSVVPGRRGVITARAALAYLQKAVELLKNKEIAGVVTAPVCKETIHQIDPGFRGHTEFFASAFGVKDVGMMFVSGRLRTILVTRHIPLRQVSESVTSSVVYETIRLADQALKSYFKIKHPRIAVCGLNPHAGEGGTIGGEEIEKIIPAIAKAGRNAMRVDGPFAADTLFAPAASHRYDAIVAMYHDQGLIPIKTLHFAKLVNLTVGLPFVRTSPAHGTAFDIAGKNKADASSMVEAIKLAVKLANLISHKEKT
mgnify:CR=1 FL=1